MPGLNSTGKGILKLILRGESLTQGEISKRLGLPKTCISRELQTLERLNIVELCQDSRDGRQMIPTLKITRAITDLESAVRDLVGVTLAGAA
jgi:uncharacterized membrane protein